MSRPVVPPRLHAADLRILEARAPNFLRWLATAAPAVVSRSPHGARQTLVLDGIHLASPLNPAAEADFVADQALPRRVAHAWVYGTGNELIRAALARADKLTVVGLSARASAAQIAETRPSWLGDPRVSLLSPHEAPTPQTPRLIAAAELRMADISPIRDRLLFAQARASQDAFLGARVARREQVGRANRARYPEDAPVSSIFGAGRAWAAVAAGGPTLLSGLASFAARRAEGTLIAVSTALVPLLRAGVPPDVVVMVDPHPALGRHLDGVDPEVIRTIPLVYALDLHPDVLARWPGPRLAALLDLPSYQPLMSDHPIGSLFCSGTVTHAALDLAVKMGASDVVLLGADLAFPGGLSHAEGAVFERAPGPIKVQVESVSGTSVATDVNLLSYLRAMEQYLEKTPNVRFWNTSTTGARIAGAEPYRP